MEKQTLDKILKESMGGLQQTMSYKERIGKEKMVNELLTELYGTEDMILIEYHLTRWSDYLDKRRNW